MRAIYLRGVNVSHSLDLRGAPGIKNCVNPGANEDQAQRGFTLIELMLVVFFTVLITAMAVTSIPTISRNYRIGGDTRSITAQINLARMRAASGFTHARVYMKLDANSYRLETWNKSGSCWQTDGDSNSCTQSTSPITALATGDTFGFGTISAGPTTATSTIAQAGSCKPGVAGASAGTAIANTACIEFNSRGFPVDTSNAIVANDAIYLGTNSTDYYAVAVTISGQPAAYRYGGSSWVQY